MREVLGSHLGACWASHRSGDRCPRSPALASRATLRRLEHWRRDAAAGPAERCRAEVLWRLCADAGVEADPAVRGSAAEPSAALFDARNQAARTLGWADYHQLRLALEGIDDAAMSAALRQLAGPADDPGPAPTLGADAVALASADLEVAGFPIGRTRVDRGPAPARTYLIAPPDDVRVVVPAGEDARTVRQVWHELGHAACAASSAADLSWSLTAGPSRVLHEAVAEAVAGRLEDPATLRRVDVPAAVASEVASFCRRRRRRWSGRQAARAAFERHAYREPDGDLDGAWHRLHRELAGAPPHRSWRALHQLASDPGAQLAYAVGAHASRALVVGPALREWLREGALAGASRPGSPGPT